MRGVLVDEKPASGVCCPMQGVHRAPRAITKHTKPKRKPRDKGDKRDIEEKGEKRDKGDNEDKREKRDKGEKEAKREIGVL